MSRSFSHSSKQLATTAGPKSSQRFLRNAMASDTDALHFIIGHSGFVIHLSYAFFEYRDAQCRFRRS